MKTIIQKIITGVRLENLLSQTPLRKVRVEGDRLYLRDAEYEYTLQLLNGRSEKYKVLNTKHYEK